MTIKPGQFWTMETDGCRVEVIYLTQYALDQMVAVRKIDATHPETEVRAEWFANHATLLHDSLGEAQLEALLFNRELSHLAETNRLVTANTILRDELQHANWTIDRMGDALKR